MKARWMALAVCVALLGGAATLLPGADTLPPPGQPAKPTAAEQQLAAMLRDREKTAAQFLESSQAAYEASTITLGDYLDAIRKMSEAEMSLATSPQEALDRLKKNLTRLQQLEKKIGTLRKGSNTGISDRDLAHVKFDRQSAEISVAMFRIQSKL